MAQSKPRVLRVLMVPSADIKPVDSLEGTRTLLRLEAAVKEWRRHRYDYLVVCGAQCFDASIQTKPIAITMAEKASSMGFPKEAIIVQARSRDTYEDLAFTLEHLKPYPGPWEITVESHWQHVLRFAITGRLAHGRWIRMKPVWYWLPLKEMALEAGLLLYHLYDWKGKYQLARNNRSKRAWAGATQASLEALGAPERQEGIDIRGKVV